MSDHSGPALKILVVDDEPALRSFAEVLLEDLGYSAALADSGRAAVQLLLQDPEAIAAVLLDMTMPGMSPQETFRLLREIRPDLPVIILSGDLETTVRERFGPGTIAGYIAKPYSDCELAAALKEALTPPVSPAPSRAEAAPPRSAAFKLVRLAQDERAAMEREYLVKCRLDLPGMADSLARRDFASLQVMGHSLKGSGGCFGFLELTRLGRALESSAQAADARTCGEQLEAVKNYLEHPVRVPPT